MIDEFSHLNGKKILVTGSNGFIGRNLIKKLKELNLDFTEFKGDILEGISEKEDYDLIFHLAAKVPQNTSDEEDYAKVNVEGVKLVLEFCKEKNSKIIYTSTIGVHGDVKEVVTENSIISPNLTPYASSKFKGEDICKEYSKKYGVNCCILRFSTVYGFGQEGGYLIPTLIRALKEDKVAKLRDKNAFRDYIHVEDVIDTLLSSTKIDNSIINVAYEKTYSVGEIVELVRKISGKNLKVEYSKLEDQEIKGFKIDISLSKKLLKWDPKINIEEGIKRILIQEHLL
jgi:UDP-glucose 4-epimerase|tara:strand:- start:7089 stop:7943 length:855 start_codon:yes stop_codon:yes gene_type:complete